jgi:hypothetical protein
VARRRADDLRRANEARDRKAAEDRARQVEEERQRQAVIRRDGLRNLFHHSKQPRPIASPEIASAKKQCLAGSANACKQARETTQRLAKAAAPAAPPPVDTSKVTNEKKDRYNSCMSAMARETIPETGSGLEGFGEVNAAIKLLSGNLCTERGWPSCKQVVNDSLQTRGGGLPKRWAAEVGVIGRRFLNLPMHWSAQAPQCIINTEDVAQIPFWCAEAGATHDNCLGSLKRAAYTLDCAEKTFHFVEHAEAADAYVEYAADHDAKCRKNAGL